jgi:hypothetical protein
LAIMPSLQQSTVPCQPCEALSVAAADPDRLFDDWGFCFREYCVVRLGRISASP